VSSHPPWPIWILSKVPSQQGPSRFNSRALSPWFIIGITWTKDFGLCCRSSLVSCSTKLRLDETQ